MGAHPVKKIRKTTSHNTKSRSRSRTKQTKRLNASRKK